MNFKDETTEAYKAWFIEAGREDMLTMRNAFLAGVTFGLESARSVFVDSDDARRKPRQ